jgi:general transcription factor 3C polypeptide 5 (transcription factor C subunit 1)
MIIILRILADSTLQILDSENIEACVPLYLRHNNPMSVPILSRNNATDNILLKITVPKRTGRKRKRGSQETFSGTVPIDLDTTSDNIQSHSRRDDPAVLLRALKDNVDKYEVEVVAAIEQTHRFRGK